RMITGNAGILVSRVVHIKRNGDKTFAVIDAAMNDLIRPTLYDAWHDIMPVAESAGTPPATPVDVVGPVCESGDFMARDRLLPPLSQGDLIAIMTAGAYGAVQSGTYNSRPLIPEVLVKAGNFSIVRPRQTYEDLIGRDRLATWQQPSR
ncbi:MAG: diaminopimelate decarboxylase family protein, partial [Aestuariivirgaceae bacterium]